MFIELGSITHVLNKTMGYELFEWSTKLYQNSRPNTYSNIIVSKSWRKGIIIIPSI